jgi:hypothetical protein
VGGGTGLCHANNTGCGQGQGMCMDGKCCRLWRYWGSPAAPGACATSAGVSCTRSAVAAAACARPAAG